MNTKTLPHQNTPTAKHALFAMVSKFVSRLTALIQRSDLEKAQAHYRLKHKLQANSKTRVQGDLLRDMPLKQKLQLGYYHLMD